MICSPFSSQCGVMQSFCLHANNVPFATIARKLLQQACTRWRNPKRELSLADSSFPLLCTRRNMRRSRLATGSSALPPNADVHLLTGLAPLQQ